LAVKRLTFLPKGEVANNYIADCASGERYLLKVLGNSRQVRKNTAGFDLSLCLTWHLHATGLFTRLAHPLKTRTDKFDVHINDLRIILFHFVEGQTLASQWPYSDKMLTSIARAIASIHKTTPHLRIEIPRVEQFDIPFADELLNGLDTLQVITPHYRQGQQKLKELLLPHRERIVGYLGRLCELQRMARAVPRTMVLCHTDLTPDNLLVNEQGELYILDWEGALLAPPEHDLFFFTGKHFSDFLNQYMQEYGSANLDGNLLGFYFYRRNLEDLTDWMIRILRENTHDEQDENDLNGIVQDCMDGWPLFETAIEQVKAQITNIESQKRLARLV
jgi:thiamine kinase-like enzyme